MQIDLKSAQTDNSLAVCLALLIKSSPIFSTGTFLPRLIIVLSMQSCIFVHQKWFWPRWEVFWEFNFPQYTCEPPEANIRYINHQRIVLRLSSFIGVSHFSKTIDEGILLWITSTQDECEFEIQKIKHVLFGLLKLPAFVLFKEIKQGLYVMILQFSINFGGFHEILYSLTIFPGNNAPFW